MLNCIKLSYMQFKPGRHPIGTSLEGNTKGGSITVPLTSCLTGLESAVWLLTIVVYLQNRLIMKNENNYLNTNIYSHLETSDGQSSNLNLNVIHFFNTSVK
jgi:hypothetical protein